MCVCLCVCESALCAVAREGAVRAGRCSARGRCRPRRPATRSRRRTTASTRRPPQSAAPAASLPSLPPSPSPSLPSLPPSLSLPSPPRPPPPLTRQPLPAQLLSCAPCPTPCRLRTACGRRVRLGVHVEGDAATAYPTLTPPALTAGTPYTPSASTSGSHRPRRRRDGVPALSHKHPLPISAHSSPPLPAHSSLPAGPFFPPCRPIPPPSVDSFAPSLVPSSPSFDSSLRPLAPPLFVRGRSSLTRTPRPVAQGRRVCPLCRADWPAEPEEVRALPLIHINPSLGSKFPHNQGPVQRSPGWRRRRRARGRAGVEWGRTQGNRLESVRERARGASTRYLSDSEMSDRQARGRARSIAMHGERDSEWAKKRLGGRGLTRRAAVSRSSAVPHQAKAATSGKYLNLAAFSAAHRTPA